MNKQEAMIAMVNGKKVSHNEVIPGGYYCLDNTSFEFVTPKGERARAQLKHEDGYFIFVKKHVVNLDYWITPSVVNQLMNGHEGPICVVKDKSSKARVNIKISLEVEE